MFKEIDDVVVMNQYRVSQSNYMGTYYGIYANIDLLNIGKFVLLITFDPSDVKDPNLSFVSERAKSRITPFSPAPWVIDFSIISLKASAPFVICRLKSRCPSRVLRCHLQTLPKT